MTYRGPTIPRRDLDKDMEALTKWFSDSCKYWVDLIQKTFFDPFFSDNNKTTKK